MKTKIMYEIYVYRGNSYSRRLSLNLRSKDKADKLIKRLSLSGIEAFASPLKISEE